MRWVSKGVHLSKFFVLMGRIVRSAIGVSDRRSIYGRIGPRLSRSSVIVIAVSRLCFLAFHSFYPTFKNIIELLFDTPEIPCAFLNSVKIVGVILYRTARKFAVSAACRQKPNRLCRRHYIHVGMCSA